MAATIGYRNHLCKWMPIAYRDTDNRGEKQ